MLGPLSVTVTPGSTAPDESVALPNISPVCDWAAANVAAKSSATNAKTNDRTLIFLLQNGKLTNERIAAGHRSNSRSARIYSVSAAVVTL